MPVYPDNFRNRKKGDGAFSFWGTPRFVLGFSEDKCRVRDFTAFFPAQPVCLKQTHSTIIHRAERTANGTKGDGWMVRQINLPVIIKTADCVPLFYWSETESCGGILHIGWRGLHGGIEQKLLRMTAQDGVPLKSLRFLIGPGIEKKCYPVGEDLFTAFHAKPWRRRIFAKRGPGRYLMDLKLGISLSLQMAGIPAAHISDARLCTLCLKDRFPSFRRDGKTGERIYNFFMLRGF